MIKCPFCQTVHVANTLFCSECGTYLLEDDRRGTDSLGTGEIGWVGTEEEASEQLAKQGSGPLGVRLFITGKLEGITHKIKAMKRKAYGFNHLSSLVLLIIVANASNL